MNFEPDYRHFADVMKNRRPARLPIYEHSITPSIMETVLDKSFSDLQHGDVDDLHEFYRHCITFFNRMTYDVVPFEIGVTWILPNNGALKGGKPGPIQSRDDFEQYPWAELPARFWDVATPRLDAMAAVLPPGMKLVGGIGNGVFEISEDLVGLEYLPFMQVDDPQLYADLFCRIGDLLETLWRKLLGRYADLFVACRFGDDLGFRTSLLTNPQTVRQHILPQYQRIINLVHAHKLPFLWHSCGCIFEIMEDVIVLGINAKHSNEDTIAPFDRWIESYGQRIGFCGGFDLDFLCSESPQAVFKRVVKDGQRFRQTAQGYALGSGNSIPDYVPTENYLAMIRAAQRIRELEEST